MTPFTSDFTSYFKELAANNNREWFHDNKKRYEKFVKEPFKLFVQEMIDRISKDDPRIKIEPKDAIFRIARDIRFSKDKTPYKMHVGAVISPKGRKDMVSPGLYLQLSAEDVRVYGGVYMAQKDQLYNIRSYIAKNGATLTNIVNDKKFKKTFGKIHGEKNKIIPKEFKVAAEQQPLIYNKGWYYFTKEKPSLIAKPELFDVLIEHYYTGKPAQEFFEMALRG